MAAPTTSTASTAGGSSCSGSGTPSAAPATAPTPATDPTESSLGARASGAVLLPHAILLDGIAEIHGGFNGWRQRSFTSLFVGEWSTGD